jgi:predicted  nucleic acid-binding Zn-ribbon protein
MSAKKGKTADTKNGMEDSQELEFYLINDDTFADLVQQIGNLSNEVDQLKEENESLSERVADLERRITAARYS